MTNAERVGVPAKARRCRAGCRLVSVSSHFQPDRVGTVPNWYEILIHKVLLFIVSKEPGPTADGAGAQIDPELEHLVLDP